MMIFLNKVKNLEKCFNGQNSINKIELSDNNEKNELNKVDY